MNTQNTPVHVRLWHRDFWLMSLSTLLLSVAVYILIPTMPEWLMQKEHFTPMEVGLAMGAFGIGLFTFGPCCSYMVERYRRNRVCILSVFGVIACLLELYYVHSLRSQIVSVGLILLQRFFLGAFFGFAQMVLSSTLIIDTSESFKRTEANFSAAWFARFAISLGPMLGLVIFNYFRFDAVVLAAVFSALLSVVFILTVRFPFRSPSDNLRVFSLDRFLLPGSMPLFINLALVSLSLGMIMTLGLSDRFYAIMMIGFLFALLAQRFVFRDADLKSEVVSGLILMLAAELMIYTRPLPIVWYLSPLCIGLAVGLTSSRFLMFFIKLSHHCKRGTSQSMYLLSWELGMSLGLCMGFMLFFNDDKSLLITAMAVTAATMLLYTRFTHNWFITHKNR
ncbi:MAG: MFS transporter [Prevotella sp.]|nr:MFS transporter [Prevotella sp.]